MRNIERYQKLIELIDEKFIPRILKSGYHYNEKTNENERIYYVDLKDLEDLENLDEVVEDAKEQEKKAKEIIDNEKSKAYRENLYVFFCIFF